MRPLLAKLNTFARNIFLRFFNFFLVASVIIVFVLGYYFFIGPRIQGIRIGGQASLEAKRAQAEELKKYLEALNMMRSDYERFTPEKIQMLNSLLPREEDIPGLMVVMQKIAEQNHFILNNIDVAPSENGPEAVSEDLSKNAVDQSKSPEAQLNQPPKKELPAGVNELNVSFVVTGGNYDNLKSFITDLEHNIRLFDIIDITFGSVIEGPYSINMRTYYLSN